MTCEVGHEMKKLFVHISINPRVGLAAITNAVDCVTPSPIALCMLSRNFLPILASPCEAEKIAVRREAPGFHFVME